MMFAVLILLLSVSVLPVHAATGAGAGAGICDCGVTTLDIATALAIPGKGAFCRFGFEFFLCLKTCDETAARKLRTAMHYHGCAVCSASRLLVPSLLLAVPVLFRVI